MELAIYMTHFVLLFAIVPCWGAIVGLIAARLAKAEDNNAQGFSAANGWLTFTVFGLFHCNDRFWNLGPECLLGLIVPFATAIAFYALWLIVSSMFALFARLDNLLKSQ